MDWCLHEMQKKPHMDKKKGKISPKKSMIRHYNIGNVTPSLPDR